MAKFTLEDLADYLSASDFESSSFFTNPDFLDAIVGTTEEGNVVYSYADMVTSLMKSQNISQEEAIEFINYKTLRTIPYMPSPAPIIIYPLPI